MPPRKKKVIYCKDCKYRANIEDTNLYCCGIHSTDEEGFRPYGGSSISKKLLIVDDNSGCTWGIDE